MTAAPSDPLPMALPEVPPTPAAALGRLSATGAALLEEGRTDEAVDVLGHAVAAAEPGADDLLTRAYIDSGDWYAAVDLLTRLVAHGHVRFAGRLGVALAQVGDIGRAEEAFLLALEHGELAAGNDYAILLAQENRFDEAVPLLRRSLDPLETLALRWDVIRVRMYLASSLTGLGQRRLQPDPGPADVSGQDIE